ncbi:hypothetical protein [Pseudomonas aeruginosa]
MNAVEFLHLIFTAEQEARKYEALEAPLQPNEKGDSTEPPSLLPPARSAA